MDPLFERFERLVRSMLHTPGDRDYTYDRDYIFSEHGKRDTYDRDFRDAWDELGDYLRGGPGDTGGPRSSERVYEKRRSSAGPFEGRTRSRSASPLLPPEDLRKDYRRLGVPFAAPFEDVRKAYRELIRTHHPDVHGSNMEAADRATSRSQDINESFQRIKVWVEGHES